MTLHIYIEYYFKGSKSFHEPIVNNFEKLKDIKLFINEIIEKSEDKNVDIETKKNSCELLSYAILPLYKALGYKDYVDSNEVSFGDRWELKIR